MIKFLIEFSPPVAFFIGYKTEGILQATLYMLIASVISIIAGYALERKFNKVNIISTLILLISATLTLFSGNSVFIKLKPTILYCIFASLFLVTSFKWKPAAKHLLGSAIELRDDNMWKILNLRFMWFFIVMAILNEIIWRNFAEDTWVNFKVFGALPITIAFFMSQVPFLIRNKVNKLIS